MDKEKKKSTEASEAQAPAADIEKTPVPEKDSKPEIDSEEKATEADNAAKASTEGTIPEADEKSEKTATEGAESEKNAEKETPPPEVPAETRKGEAESIPGQDLQMELLNTKVQLAAFKSGVRGEVVEDAVCLALHDAKKTGEVSEKSVAQALKGVLNRHPEWKQEAASAGNFRVGAESGKMPNTASDEISKIFGNT